MTRSILTVLRVVGMAISLAVLVGCPTEPEVTIATADPLVRMSPSVGGRGMNLTLLLRGVNTQWQQGEVSIDVDNFLSKFHQI